MSHDPTLRAFDPAAQSDTMARLLSLAFAGPVEGCKQWMELGGHENLRVFAPENATPQACLLRIPMGQYFGGRSVPMVGIAGVAVAPEARGQGLARSMMQAALRDAAASGAPLMGLYASTQTLYRSVGFEQAGSRCRIRVPMAWLDARSRAGQILPIADTSHAGVRACYADFAARTNGMLDRGEYIWKRIKKNRGVESEGFGVAGPAGTLDGYIFFNQQRLDSGRHDLVLTDFAFRTPDALRRLMGFLADFAPMADHLEFFGGSDHPALLMLSQQRHQISMKECWYIRLINLKAALEARGYNSLLRAELHLDVDDQLLPANSGRWVLCVEGGRGTLTPGGNGQLRIGPRGLAPLYSGFQSAESLELIQLCQGPAETLAAASAIFAGRAPAMTDFF